ncbi:hypothetical protein NDU88_006160 [Pleurodeles waltl]|uniref:Uncharacterized protein n=1 Tax=Pleurodeles waltl TaxID=8319 RepID=A0AAV7VP32_PLEWA|nr:hypothetical protein NDU88_006160 [Pleurodeles waltl]
MLHEVICKFLTIKERAIVRSELLNETMSGNDLFQPRDDLPICGRVQYFHFRIFGKIINDHKHMTAVRQTPKSALACFHGLDGTGSVIISAGGSDGPTADVTQVYHSLHMVIQSWEPYFTLKSGFCLDYSLMSGMS